MRGVLSITARPEAVYWRMTVTVHEFLTRLEPDCIASFYLASSAAQVPADDSAKAKAGITKATELTRRGDEPGGVLVSASPFKLRADPAEPAADAVADAELWHGWAGTMPCAARVGKDEGRRWSGPQRPPGTQDPELGARISRLPREDGTRRGRNSPGLTG
jgi:hypothetical protein